MSIGNDEIRERNISCFDYLVNGCRILLKLPTWKNIIIV